MLKRKLVRPGRRRKTEKERERERERERETSPSVRLKLQRERGTNVLADGGGEALGILRTDPDPQPSSDIIFWEGKREGKKRGGEGGRERVKLWISRRSDSPSDSRTENQPTTVRNVAAAQKTGVTYCSCLASLPLSNSFPPSSVLLRSLFKHS